MKLTTLIVAAAALATSALAQDVGYNFDAQADFTKYKTYKWVDIKGAQKPNEIVDKQIVAAIDSELAKKGLSKVTTDTADLYIGYQTAIGQEKQINTFDTGGAWGYGPGWRGGYGMGGMTTATTSTILIGTLDLDMYDAGKKNLVWRGNASKTLDPKAKPDKKQKNIEKAVAKLLKNYPPKEKK
jgi:hypothetical protein